MQSASPPDVAWMRGRVFRGAILVASFVAVSLLQQTAYAYAVGLEFIDAPTPSPPPFFSDFEPFPIVAPENFFVSQGGLAGWTENEAQRAVALAIEDVFNAVDVGDPNHWLNLSIHLGPAPSTLPGQRLNVALGQSAGFMLALGETPRPGDYDNPNAADTVVAAVYIDNINDLGASLVTYDTASGAINAIAGTAAHEIGHVFGADHVVTSAGAAEPLPIMAVEGTGLPTAARLTERRFSDLQPEPVSNADVIVANMGTAARGDSDFNGTVDENDLLNLVANWEQSDRLRFEGDANGDHWVDNIDAFYLIDNWTAGSFAASGVSLAQWSAVPLAHSRGISLMVPEPDGILPVSALVVGILCHGAGSRAGRIST